MASVPLSGWLGKNAAIAYLLRVPCITQQVAICCRRQIACAVNWPCFQAFRLPFGAPGDGPPCIRQRPLAITGERCTRARWHLGGGLALIVVTRKMLKELSGGAPRGTANWLPE